MSSITSLSRSVEETDALGAALAPALRDGDVVVLSGPLGAGKTRLVAGVARGLGCAARVRSPSFTLLRIRRHGTARTTMRSSALVLSIP